MEKAFANQTSLFERPKMCEIKEKQSITLPKVRTIKLKEAEQAYIQQLVLYIYMRELLTHFCPYVLASLPLVRASGGPIQWRQ